MGSRSPTGKGTFEGWTIVIVSGAAMAEHLHLHNTPAESSCPLKYTGVVR